MTKDDLLKFCEKGSHDYEITDVVRTIFKDGWERKGTFLLYNCRICPSRWLKDL